MKMHAASRFRMRAFVAAASLMVVTAANNAAAFEFPVGDLTTVKLDSLFTIGASMRMESRDPTLIGKSSLTPGLCVGRDGDDGVTGANPDREQNQYHGTTCNPGQPDPSGQGFANANEYFVHAPGSFNPNGDNGNLNFDKGDIVNAAAKITSDLSFDLYDFNFFVRGLALFDQNYQSFEQTHPDTTFNPKHTSLSADAENRLDLDYRLLDYFVSRTFEFADRQFNIKVGNQVLNWGESSFLLANSLNSINPPDQARLRVPGFDIKELSQPQGMVVFNAELVSGINLETFYQYEWKPVIADPVGSFFSQSDIVGEGGEYAMLSFAKAPEDPLALYAPRFNPDSPIPVIGKVGDPAYILNSDSSRTIFVDKAASAAHKPKDGGQYGAALKFFLDELNGGTEIGLYYANYHSRVPSISGYAAQATCLPDSVSPGVGLAQALNGCGLGVPELADPVTLANLALSLPNPQIPIDYENNEPLPLDTARLFIEYPEDIHMYGISFNTTVGDWALSGEYVFRDNLPIQIHSTDLVFALLQPAFPANDLDLTIADLPGRRTAVPDFIQTNYRGVQTNPGDYVAGFERQKIGQANLSALKTFGGDNFLKASQITFLLETGLTHLPDMPGLDELQFQGAGTDTHISAGADGSVGINPRDIRRDPNDPYSNVNDEKLTLMQNPTSWSQQDIDGFASKFSWGYRLVTLTRYDDAVLGANIELLNAFFHDVNGVSPGLGQNFVQGRMQYISGVRFDYLSTFQGEIRYTWYFGGGVRDGLRDRDYLLMSLGYAF